MVIFTFGITMLVPLGVAWGRGEPSLVVRSHALALVVTIAVGVLLSLASWVMNRERAAFNARELAQEFVHELSPRNGVMLVTLVWSTLPLFAGLPLWLFYNHSGTPLSFTNAYFEGMSALTTTGATVLGGLDELPASINLWRCFVQWIGGMGILVLAVAILPLLGVGGSQLFRAEAAGPIKDAKLTPRIAETAKGLWRVYVIVSLLCLLAYRLGGMSWIEAWTHMFATTSLGGLSSHDTSFGYFNSPLLEWIAVVFMLISSCNFALYFVAFRTRSLTRLLSDPETRGTLGLLIGASLFVSAFLMVKGVYADPLVALRMAFFQVVSVGSTTGFATTDYSHWPMFVPILMLILSGVSTSAGSTGAGIKMIRLILLCKQARREMQRMLHPRAVNPMKFHGRTVSTATLLSVVGFMLVYGMSVIVLTLVLMATDLEFDTAFAAVLGCINNMGPGLNELGPAGNFNHLSDFQTWVCTFAMLLGRLELLSVLVLLTPQYWRNR